MESVPVRFQILQIILMSAAVFSETDLPPAHMDGKEEEEEKEYKDLEEVQ